MVVIPDWAIIPLCVFGLLAGICMVVFLIFKYGAGSKKIKEGWDLLEAGDLRESFSLFRSVAKSAVAQPEFKIFPWEQSALEKAMDGMEAVYENAEIACNLSKLHRYHEKYLEFVKEQRRGSDCDAEIKSLRKQARAFLERLPSV